MQKNLTLKISNYHWKAFFIPLPMTEFMFHINRKWRFDFAWPDKMIALEQEGGIWTYGRHSIGKGFILDIEKYNSATMLGWRVFRCTPQQLESGEILEFLRQLFEK